jgi:hypothetical protein
MEALETVILEEIHKIWDAIEKVLILFQYYFNLIVLLAYCRQNE